MNDLFIGGGGYSGIMFIGALEYIHENKLLDLKNFYGCSIGSLIGCLYISGYTPKNMLSKFLELKLDQIVKYDLNSFHSANHIIEDKLLETLIGFLWESENRNENGNGNENISKDITIKQFSDKFKVNINILATNITRNCYTNLNEVTYPNVKLKDAIKASMSIPFLFKPVEINGEIYVDGCCKNIYGSPPPEIYICGYSIILSSIVKNYTIQVFSSMTQTVKPRSTFLIECNNATDPNMYMNLDKLNNNYIINMYKTGINFAKKSLKG